MHAREGSPCHFSTSRSPAPNRQRMRAKKGRTALLESFRAVLIASTPDLISYAPELVFDDTESNGVQFVCFALSVSFSTILRV